MWLNIVWKDAGGVTLREDGEYGTLALGYDIDGDAINDSVETLLDPHDPNTRIYEAHGAITQEWATKLIAVSASYGAIPVAYDRQTGVVAHTIADIAALNPGEYYETFHFVLNNKVVKDSRIPPYGMAYDESLRRSILPVPATQYGNPGPGGIYDYWDEVTLNPPTGAVSADIQLMYQPTSWEYIQFLDHANDGSVTFLADEGTNILDAWLNTGMAVPHVMASTIWLVPPTIDAVVDVINDPLHVNHQGQGGLPNDTVQVAVMGASTLVGDPEDLDASLIDPASIRFGPAEAMIDPASTPDLNYNHDNDGIPDARFEFRMDDTGFPYTPGAGYPCSASPAELSGELSTGVLFLGTDTTVSTDCLAPCH